MDDLDSEINEHLKLLRSMLNTWSYCFLNMEWETFNHSLFSERLCPSWWHSIPLKQLCEIDRVLRAITESGCSTKWGQEHVDVHHRWLSHILFHFAKLSSRKPHSTSSRHIHLPGTDHFIGKSVLEYNLYAWGYCVTNSRLSNVSCILRKTMKNKTCIAWTSTYLWKHMIGWVIYIV